MDLGIRTHFSKAQLQKLHKQFYHPSSEKLFNLIRVARPEHATPETLEILKDISRRCDPCQRIHTKPNRFRVKIGAETCQFNERLMMDIMYLRNQKTPVLHIVDEGTRFSAVCLMKNVTVGQYVWEALLKCWVSVFTGLPNRILVDEGTNFGQAFIHLARVSNVEVKATRIEAHSSLGVRERYHAPLRNTWRKIKAESPKVDDELALHLAVKAMNDTVGPEGLMPSALVFGEYPRVFTPDEPIPARATTASRIRLMETTRKEIAEQLATVRIKRALKHSTSSSANTTFKKGDKVLVWREKIVNSRIGEWMGPYTVDRFNPRTKLVFIKDEPSKTARPFGIVQVKHFLEPDTVANSFFADIHDGLRRFKSPREEDTTMFLTEVLHPRDPRASSQPMADAICNEVRGLVERGTFKVVLRKGIPPDANCMPGRFVLALKSKDDGTTKFKARFVIGGHRDRFKHYMVHNAITVQPSTIRLLLALAAMFSFDVWSSDVTQAYLQSTSELGREIFIKKVAPEFELEPEECLQLLKPLYGLSESGDHWFNTRDQHHHVDLGMTPLRSDPALYKSMANGLLIGLSGSYVDDMMRAGTKKFKEQCKATHDKFEMTPDEYLPCLYSVFVLDKGDDGSLMHHQRHYMWQLEHLPLDAPLSSFRSMRMKLAWLAHTRPDCQFEISQLAQVTPERFEKGRVPILKRVNRAITFALNHNYALKIPKLDKDSLRVVGFSDASFGNNHDLSTQLGHICFLIDGNNSAAPISFKSYKSKRVVRSAMVGEVIAFSDLFDVASTLSSEMGQILGRDPPVQLLTDSKCLFDLISKGSRTSEKRTMLDISAAREGFRDKVISDIGFIRSARNIADGFTKPMKQCVLQEILSAGYLNVRS